MSIFAVDSVICKPLSRNLLAPGGVVSIYDTEHIEDGRVLKLEDAAGALREARFEISNLKTEFVGGGCSRRKSYQIVAERTTLTHETQPLPSPGSATPASRLPTARPGETPQNEPLGPGIKQNRRYLRQPSEEDEMFPKEPSPESAIETNLETFTGSTQP